MLYNNNINLALGLPETIKYFKQESICKIFNVPLDKPCVETICDVFINPKIMNYKLIRTECGLSNEGQKLTGNKLSVDLSIDIKITYTGKYSNESIYAIDYNVLKNLFVIVPNEVDGKNVQSLVDASRLTLLPYIEHYSTSVLDERDIATSILMLLDVKFC